MVSKITFLWRCIIGPTLYKRYDLQSNIADNLHHDHSHPGDYDASRIEAITSTAINGTMSVIRFAYALWPLTMIMMYRRGYFTQDGALYMTKMVIVFAIIFGPAYALRGLARLCNNEYAKFMNILIKAQNEQSRSPNSLAAIEAMEQLRNYDFDFDAWPVDYSIKPENVAKSPHLFRYKEERELNIVQYQLNSFLANFLGVRMIYPGCTGLINSMIGPQLVIHRAKWLTERGGRRQKLLTPLGDEIDSCFVDRRTKNKEGNQNGNILVITCEGNAGFWEVGAMATPDPLGYSLLGWNHPGFAGSSGWPFPTNDRAAIATVYHYATTELGFSSQNIVVFAWSIGGYTSSWLASVANPPVRALVLDATFDNIEAMAQRQMPQLLHPFVTSTVRSHFNLDVARNVKAYSGPVTFIRRTRDEIISLVPGEVATNCINNLIISVLRHRFPALLPKVSENMEEMETLDQLYSWLSEPLEVQTMLNFRDRSDCRDYIKAFSDSLADSPDSNVTSKDLGADQPLEFRRKLLAYVLLHCVKDFAATHCTPLPEDYFRIPTNVV